MEGVDNNPKNEKTKLTSNEKCKDNLSTHMESRERERNLGNLCCGSLVLKLRVSPRKVE